MDHAKRFWLIAGPDGVERRVAEGGHDVDEAVVRRRFERSHRNLPMYTAAADLWRIYETSGPKPCLAAEGKRGRLTYVDTDCLAGANPATRAFAASFES